MHYDYKPQGICPWMIHFDVDDEKCVHNIKYDGGCDGNLKMISKMAEGQKAEDLIRVMEGNLCKTKGTSCADQLAKALKQAI